jgi:putative transposase
VIHRGINRQCIFGDDMDHEVFLTFLEAAMSRHAVAVHCFALMKTHYHLIVTPGDERALPNAMRRLGIRYVLYYNRKYGRVGTLWTGRYKGLPIEDENYWLTCLRYVELNPVRAQIVHRPEDYRWSSYRVHAFGEPSRWLVEHHLYTAFGRTPEERQAAYRALCSQPLTEADLLRHCSGSEDLPAALSSLIDVAAMA